MPPRPQRSELPETIAVGRVLRPHGLRGELAVEVLSDVERRFAPGTSLLLVRDGVPPVPLVVAACRISGSSTARQDDSDGDGGGGEPVATGRRSVVLLRFAGIEDRDRAATLRGAWLEVERSRVPPAPAGTYYHFELVGCRCWNRGEELGEVVRVVEDGGGLLLVVANGSREVPVPFVKRFLASVDVAEGRIEMDLPDGLVETCASRS